MPKQRYEITEVYRAFDGHEWAIGYKGGHEVATCSSRDDAYLVRDALDKRLSYDALLAVCKRLVNIAAAVGRGECHFSQHQIDGAAELGRETRAAIALAEKGDPT